MRPHSYKTEFRSLPPVDPLRLRDLGYAGSRKLRIEDVFTISQSQNASE